MNRHIIATLWNGKMVSQNNPRNPNSANFVICCDYGDWSGFRTLAECEVQYPELCNKGRPNGYFWVEER